MTFQPGYAEGCPHCPDGHYPADKRTWSVYLGPERDGDGQPTTIHVGRPNGAHCAESDADWIRQMLNPHLRGKAHNQPAGYARRVLAAYQAWRRR